MNKFILPLAIFTFSLNSLSAQILVKEDFSLFTAGSEKTPDQKDIADEMTTIIPKNYTNTPNWTGAAVHQAGGVCFISNYSTGWDLEDGYLDTPVADYSGTITIQFRARTKNKGNHNGTVNVTYRSMSLAGEKFTMTDTWQKYTITLNVEASNKSAEAFIQFAGAYDEFFYIDDIVVERKKTILPYPTAKQYTNQTFDGFTAHWEAVPNIETYILSVYSKAPLSANDSIMETFDAKKSWDDNSSTSHNFGSFTVNNNGYSPITVGKEKAYSNDKALLLKNGDKLTLRQSSKPVRSFAFWGKVSNTSAEGKVIIEQEVGDEFIPFIEIDTRGLGKYKYVYLSESININSTSIRVIYKGTDSLFLDNLTVYYEADHIFAEGLEAKEVKATSYLVKGLNPEIDYYYSVRSKKEEQLSLSSNEIFVYTLLPTTAFDAEHITESSFMANWKTNPRAEGYLLYNYNVYVATDNKQTIPLYKEDFDKVIAKGVQPEEATELNEGLLSLDQYTQLPGWISQNTIIAEGMLGTKGIGAAVQLPAIQIKQTNSKAKLKLFIRAWAEAGTDLSTRINGKRPNSIELIHFEKTGFIDNEIIIDYNESKPLNISFITWSGEPFLIDSIAIEATINKNDSITTLNNQIPLVGTDTKAEVTELLNEPNHYYRYNVIAYRIIGKEIITSETSNSIDVTLAKKNNNENNTPSTPQEEFILKKDTVIANKDLHITIFNSKGELLVTRQCKKGEIIKVGGTQQQLMYIIKTSTRSYKVLL